MVSYRHHTPFFQTVGEQESTAKTNRILVEIPLHVLLFFLCDNNARHLQDIFQRHVLAPAKRIPFGNLNITAEKNKLVIHIGISKGSTLVTEGKMHLILPKHPVQFLVRSRHDRNGYFRIEGRETGNRFRQFQSTVGRYTRPSEKALVFPKPYRFLLEFLRRTHESIRMVSEVLACRCQDGTSVLPLQQRDTEIPLQRLDLLGNASSPSNLGEVLVLDDGKERDNLPEQHTNLPLQTPGPFLDLFLGAFQLVPTIGIKEYLHAIHYHCTLEQGSHVRDDMPLPTSSGHERNDGLANRFPQ